MNNSSILPGRRALIALLLLAPSLELVESVTTPLRDQSTLAELGHIAGHQGRFVLSATCGLVATLLYLPMFLGLADQCRPASPRLAWVTGWPAAFSMMCFVGVRMINAVEFQTVRDGLPRRQSARMIDHLFGNPTATIAFVVFLGGALVATISLGVLTWRAGLPRVPAVLLLGFNVVDLATGYVGGIVSHAMLVIAFGWIAVAMHRRMTPDGRLGPVDGSHLVSLDDDPARNNPVAAVAPAP